MLQIKKAVFPINLYVHNIFFYKKLIYKISKKEGNNYDKSTK